ncbi:hypothetical protein [Kingella oralis]|uniref:hypothetical protein n=1 Tax=Kingella oralis TaxID=505 RepID=UPI002D810026|nr:hypothetical protein [Kingella oralis]
MGCFFALWFRHACFRLPLWRVGGSPTNTALSTAPFGDEPLPFHFGFQAAPSLFLPYHAAHRGVPTLGTLPATLPSPPALQAFRPSRCPCHKRQPETVSPRFRLPFGMAAKA